jgi:hypothetical protein
MAVTDDYDAQSDDDKKGKAEMNENDDVSTFFM